MKRQVPGPAGILAEFHGAELGDARLSGRLLEIADRVAAHPALSFPRLATTDAELEATYRFLNNERVDWRAVLAPHIEATVGRCGVEKEVVVVHDTTDFIFRTDGAREDIGVLKEGVTGFRAHFALAIGEGRRPLGVLGLQPVQRSKLSPRGLSNSERVQRLTKKPRRDKESARWSELVHETSARLAEPGRAIHVMDSEGDNFAVWGELSAEGKRFVVRAWHDRKLIDGTKLRTSLVDLEGQLLREVPIQKRASRRERMHSSKPASGKILNRRTHGLSRAARMATLHVKATSVEVPKPQTAQSALPSAQVNVVMVYEPSPPVGEDPIEWVLLTNELVETQEAMARVVDLYTTRWTIEEYFKALKTGCSFERRQLMTIQGLLNALVLLVPVAWRMLLLRHISRSGDDDARAALTEEELQLLQTLSVRMKLGSRPTASEALLALAGLGGHLKRNGPPGWQTLWAGYTKLSSAMLGWRAAVSHM